MDFHFANPLWWLGMAIGAGITLDIYLGGYEHGQSRAQGHLFAEQTEKEDAPYWKKMNEYWEELRVLIGPINIAARYTTIIGLCCLAYGKIDFHHQKQANVKDILQSKQSVMDSLIAHPLPAVTELPEYQEVQRLLENGDRTDDAGAQADKTAIMAEHRRRENQREQTINSLQVEIASLKTSLVEVDNTALFDFFGYLWKISTNLLIIISIAIAGFALDRSFGRLATKIGEYNAHIGVKMAYSAIATPEIVSNNGEEIKLNGKDIGNVNFDNQKVQEILHDIKFKYGHIKPDGKRMSFSDIGETHGVKRQYVHRIKDAAIEQGLLPADFMKKFEVA